MTDFNRLNSITIWNDRPQAGSVHDDKSIKLLIDRKIKSNDNGGIPELLQPFRPDVNLHLHFSLKAYPTEEQGKWLAKRSRSLQTFHSDAFELKKSHPNVHSQAAKRTNLVNHLQELKVTQISFTRLRDDANTQNNSRLPKVRVRLDW